MNNQNEPELPFKSPEFKQTWEEWLQFRKEKRLPKYVPTGLKKTFTALVNKSGNNEQIAIQMIEQSIEQNWQGIFELKNNIKNVHNGISKKSDGAYGLLQRIESRHT